MENYLKIIFGIIIPFLGTTIGASVVFLFKNSINKKVEKILLGFSSGVMIAAAIWSLIIPALESFNEESIKACVICVFGFISGVAFLMISNRCLNISEVKDNMLAFAITLHNIPEGIS